MSLLEDVFLQDEAGEAQELERVIEGDEYDERPVNSDDNSEKEDEAVEDKRRVDPNSTKPQRVVKNPRFILNPARLTGPRGIQVIPEHFKDFKFKGKGHEKDDLDLVLKKLEHWAYRLYPKFQFEDCLKKIESLGKKRPVMVHLQKIRSDQLLSEETVVQRDSSDEDIPPAPEEDEFDKLLQQQIELARTTPAPGSVKKGLETPAVDRSPFTMPKATSSPSISDDQKQRMMQNRKLAEERRLARLKQNSSTIIVEENDVDREAHKNGDVIAENGIVDREYGIVDRENRNVYRENGIVDRENLIVVENSIADDISMKRHNRSNVIDSDSEDDCEVTTVNQSIAVDVHETRNKDISNSSTNNDVFDSLKENNEVTKDTNNTDFEIKNNESKVIEVSVHEIRNKDISNSDTINDVFESFKENDEELKNNDKESNINVVKLAENNTNTKINEENDNNAKFTDDLNNISTNVETIRNIDEVMDSIQEVTKNQEHSQIDKVNSKVSEDIQSEEDMMDVDFSDDF